MWRARKLVKLALRIDFYIEVRKKTKRTIENVINEIREPKNVYEVQSEKLLVLTNTGIMNLVKERDFKRQKRLVPYKNITKILILLKKYINTFEISYESNLEQNLFYYHVYAFK